MRTSNGNDARIWKFLLEIKWVNKRSYEQLMEWVFKFIFPLNCCINSKSHRTTFLPDSCSFIPKSLRFCSKIGELSIESLLRLLQKNQIKINETINGNTYSELANEHRKRKIPFSGLVWKKAHSTFLSISDFRMISCSIWLPTISSAIAKKVSQPTDSR